MLTIGTIAAFAALVAIGVTIVWAPDHAGAAVVSFLYAGGAVGAGTALLYTGGRLGVAD